MATFKTLTTAAVLTLTAFAATACGTSVVQRTPAEWTKYYSTHHEAAWTDRDACQSGQIDRTAEQARCETAVAYTFFVKR